MRSIFCGEVGGERPKTLLVHKNKNHGSFQFDRGLSQRPKGTPTGAPARKHWHPELRLNMNADVIGGMCAEQERLARSCCGNLA